MPESPGETGTTESTSTTNTTVTATVTVTEHGPYMVTGSVQLQDVDGRVIETPAAGAALCRCGFSAAKPFCDGSHVANGFDGSLAS
jgi:CDGSH-type Zn-finger protein